VACGEGNLLNIKTFKVANTPEVTVKEIESGVFVLRISIESQVRISRSDSSRLSAFLAILCVLLPTCASRGFFRVPILQSSQLMKIAGPNLPPILNNY